MTRLLTPLIAFAFVSAAVTANAQTHVQPSHGHLYLADHDYWHHDLHVPDVVKLDSYSDKLAKIARHLHEDAHGLSQDYHHSETIERYVDQIDRLQKHMHEILHKAVESGTQSTELTEHVKSDVRLTKGWLNRLYGELQHQGFDGAHTADFHMMIHMRKIIVQDAFPLIGQMEYEVYGYSHNDDHWMSSHRFPQNGHDLIHGQNFRRSFRFRH